MPTIAEIRDKYPQYKDMTDEALADALHRKFYSDMPREQFDFSVGMRKTDPATSQPRDVPAYAPPGVEGYDPNSGLVAPQYSQAGSAAMGAADSTTLGWGDELASYLGSAISGVPREQVLAEMRGNAQTAQQQNPMSYLGGQIGGGLAQAAATGGAGFGTSAAKAGGSLLRVAGGSALDGALYGGAYGAGSAEDGNRILEGAKSAALGGIVGGVLPIVAAGVTKAFETLRSPLSTGAERTSAIKVLQQEGVPLTAGQKTGNSTLRYAESELGGGKAAALMDTQAEKFTDAAMRKAGGSGLATPENLQGMYQQFGQRFDDISARNSLRADPQMGSDLGAVLNRYEKLLETQQKPIVSGLVDDVISRLRAGQGTIPGSDYQVIRSDLTKAAKSATNENLAGAFRGIRDALDGAMERSISPQDAGAWQTLRRQYGNYKVLEKAAGGGGEKAGVGIISPAQLRVAASSGNRSAFARGGSDFTELAKAGQAVMTPLPNSGTAARAAVRNVGLPIGSAGAGFAVGNIPGAAIGAITPFMAGKALMSQPVQRYLSQEAPAQLSSPMRDALIAAYIRQAALPAIAGR